VGARGRRAVYSPGEADRDFRAENRNLSVGAPEATPARVDAAPAGTSWRAWLALNASTGALLAAILLVGMGSELWSPLMPEYLSDLAAPVLLIALYGSVKDLLEAVNFYLGGVLAARLDTRRALLLFNAMPLAGLGILLAWPSKYAIFVALPFVGVWNSIAGPATLRVVGDTLAEHRRSMAFSLQSIQKRFSSLLAYFVSGELVLRLGQVAGVRAALALSIALVAFSLAVQYRYMRTAVRDEVRAHHRPLELLRRFDPQLKRLLVSEICVRWCDAMPRELIILYCVPILAALFGGSSPGAEAASATAVAFYVGVLLVVLNVTSLVLYLPVGHWASRPGAAKKPFIGLTFVFFALFPLALVALGGAGGIWGLVVAFAIAGLREFGEPARKAMITELVPAECRTQAIGIYWAARGAAIAPASLAGGLIWCAAGPRATLCCAGLLGLAGAALFYARFAGRDDPA
jgi:MFS family permease